MEERISSRKNPLLQQVRKLLASRAERRKQGLFVGDGVKLLEEAVKYWPGLQTVILSDGVEAEVPEGVRVVRVPEDVMASISPMEAPQGALFLGKLPEQTEFVPKKGMLILDGVQDPGNIGTIIRTAEGAGYGAVICLKGTADVYSPKVVRAAAGSLFRMPIVTVASEQDLFELIRSLEKRLVVTCLEGDCIYYDVNLTENIALVIGNEGNGASRSLIDQADVRLRIPMKGALESLNASVAAGILMYEAMRTK